MRGSDGAHTQLGSRAVRQPPCAQWTISPSIHLPAFQALWPYWVPCPLLGQVRFSQGLVQGGERGCAGGVCRCKLLYIGWINNKVLLYSTGNYFNIL